MTDLGGFPGTCKFFIQGEEFSQPLRDLICRFPVKFSPSFASDQCFHVDRFWIDLGQEKIIDVTNSIEFCLQPLSITNFVPTVLYRSTGANVLLELTRSLDLTQAPFECLLNDRVKSPFYFV